MMFTIGFISGVMVAVIIFMLINKAIKIQLEKGEKLIDEGNRLIEQKAELQEQLNILTNVR